MDGWLLLALALPGDEVDDGTIDIAFWVEELGFVLVEVLAWVRGFVFEGFEELVECRGEEGAEEGADPVDLSWGCVSVFVCRSWAKEGGIVTQW